MCLVLKARSVGNAAGLGLSEAVGSLGDNTLGQQCLHTFICEEITGQIVKKGCILACSQLCLLLSLVSWTPAGVYQWL